MSRCWALTLPLLRRPQGVYACENNQTQNTELKGWGGYKYPIRSDYGATHSTVPSALHGLDQEFPGAHSTQWRYLPLLLLRFSLAWYAFPEHLIRQTAKLTSWLHYNLPLLYIIAPCFHLSTYFLMYFQSL